MNTLRFAAALLLHSRLSILCGLALAPCIPAHGQAPATLLHSIPAPPVGVQAGAEFGFRVAVDGGYAVLGAGLDDSGAQDSGVVKVFNSTTGALLFVLPNPSPAAGDTFGRSVAISGTRVVVGALFDDTERPMPGARMSMT
ncbi:MAG: FG-GAP repeat protein [Chthoniobacteraceae bacterium]